MRRLLGVAVTTCLAVGAITWPSTSIAEERCLYQSPEVNICGLSEQWYSMEAPEHATAQFSADGRVFAQIIVEPYGARHGVSASAAGGRIIEMAQSSHILSDFRLIMRGATEGSGDREVIVYSADLLGVPAIYATTVIVGNNHTMQISTWRSSSALAKFDQSLHLIFGASVDLSPDF